MNADQLDNALEIACGSPEYAALVLSINLYRKTPDGTHAKMVGYCLLQTIYKDIHQPTITP